MRTSLRRTRTSSPPAEPAPTADAIDGFATLDEALTLDELLRHDEPEAFAADEEAVQEVAEQTAYGAVLLEDLIRRQLRLGIRVAAVFVVVLFALPLLNLFLPDLVALRVVGLPVSWLALSVLLYPLLWTLGAYFVATAKKYEDDFTELVRK